MNIRNIFVIGTAFFVLSSPAYSQQEKKEEILKETVKAGKNETSEPDSVPENDKEKNQDLKQRCFDDYTEYDQISFCLKIVYEKAERKRRFIQEKMFEVLIEQNFMPEGEQARIDKLKMKLEAIKKKKAEGKNKEESKAIAMEKLFAQKDEDAISSFESGNDSEREKALEMMKTSDTEFEKYRTAECERQKHFYSSNSQFAELVFYSCLQGLTEQRIQTLQSSLK